MVFKKIPKECIEKSPDLQKAYEIWPAGSLTPNEVLQIFNLRLQEDKSYEFDDKELFNVPAELCT